MVVVVHGGPAGASTSSWPSRWTATLPSQGYFVFLPNPRGSFGFGEAFTEGNVKDFGGGDLRDILKGVDAVLAEPAHRIDPKRLGITGWSYGGYMTMWAVTQTDRFAAGVAGAGIASWQSYYGQNKIDTWMLPFFGASVYDDPKVYAKSSPIEFIKKVRDADARPPRRARLGGPDAPGLRVLARPEGPRRADPARDLHRRGPLDPQAREPGGHRRAAASPGSTST